MNIGGLLPHAVQLSLNTLGLAGVLSMFVSLLFRRPDAPMIGSRERRDRVPIWKTKDRYRPPGFWLLILGWGAFTVAAVIKTVAWIMS